MKEIKINEKLLDILLELKQDRISQDKFGTNNPLYIVQSRTEERTSEYADDVKLERLYIPTISEEDDFYPSIEDIRAGVLRDTNLPCNLVMNLEKKENLQEVAEEFHEYYQFDDELYETKIIYMTEQWNNKAYFLSLKKAKEYQQYQKHNLGISRIYADYVGYNNRGLLAQLLNILDNEKIEIVELK